MRLKYLFTTALSTLLFIGCTTTSTIDYAADLHDIAYLGTVVAITENPEYRQALEGVRDALAGLNQLPEDPTFDDLLGVMSALPVNELKSDKGQLYVAGGRILLRRLGKSVDVGEIKDLRPIVTALYAGIDQGLGNR